MMHEFFQTPPYINPLHENLLTETHQKQLTLHNNRLYPAISNKIKLI
jgi:hypothetical protein